MPLHDLIPAAMLAMAVVGIVCALLGKAGAAGGVLAALFVLFVISLWFPEPPAEGGRNLHWFPASLAVLLVGIPLTIASAVIGWVARRLFSAVRRVRTREDRRRASG